MAGKALFQYFVPKRYMEVEKNYLQPHLVGLILCATFLTVQLSLETILYQILQQKQKSNTNETFGIIT